MSTEYYNKENYYDYSVYGNTYSTWNQNTSYTAHTSMEQSEQIPKPQPDIEFIDISDHRGISKSFDLNTGEISYILNGVKFPEKSLNFIKEYKKVNGKDATIINTSINGELSISADGNLLLDGQPLEMNQNVKNRLAKQIKELDGQNAKLNFDNGEFSILPRVQAKDSEVVAEKMN